MLVIKRIMPSPILIFTFLCAFLSAAAIGLGMVVVLPILIAPFFLLATYFILRDRPSTVDWLVYTLGVSYVILSALWPRYIAFFLPGLPSINPTRLVDIFLVILVVSGLALNTELRRLVSTSISQQKGIWFLLFVLYIFKIASVVASEAPFQSVYQFANEVYVHLLCLPVGVYIAADRRRLAFVSKAFLVCLVVVTVFGVLEFSLKKNIFARFADPTNDYVQFAVSEKMRGGLYRAQSTLGYPIVYGEYAGLAFCFATFAIAQMSRSWQWIWKAAAFGMVVAAAYFCGSRSAVIAQVIILAYIVFSPVLVSLFQRSVSLKKLVVWIFMSGIALAVCAGMVYFAYEKAFGSGSDTTSNQLRQMMLERSIALAKDSPFVGYGVGIAPYKVGVTASAKGSFTMDSYYLSILVDSGVVALFAFISLHVYLIVRCLAHLKAAVSDFAETNFILALCAALLTSLAYKTILSQVDNHYLFFLATGFVLGIGLKKQNDLRGRVSA